MQNEKPEITTEAKKPQEVHEIYRLGPEGHLDSYQNRLLQGQEHGFIKNTQKFKTVLVIDDDQEARDGLRMLLEFKNFVVTCCQDGKSGADLIKKKRFDVIFVDYQMPELKGDETARLVRQLCPDAFIIGMSLEEKGQIFRQAGANAFISKDHLVHEIDSWTK